MKVSKKVSKRILGYSVKGCDAILGTEFVTGLERTEKDAKRSLESMLVSTYYSDKEKKSLKVVRITEITEELE